MFGGELREGYAIGKPLDGCTHERKITQRVTTGYMLDAIVLNTL